MAHKVKPTKVKEIRVGDIPPGTPFCIYGCKYVMINPIGYGEFLADVRRVISHGTQVSLVPTSINNDEIAHVAVDVSPKKYQKEEYNCGSTITSDRKDD